MPVKPFRIVIADDDADDVQLAKDCFAENHLNVEVHDVNDGQQLLDYLHQAAAQNKPALLPQLILLDLNMPRKSGLEALKELKQDTVLSRIPVIIFSTSKAQKDVDRAYDMGASCFVTKPNTLEEWTEIIGKLGRFWIDCVFVVV